MESESEIFENLVENAVNDSPMAAELIGSSSMFSYYRLQHDGKYFFFKTYVAETPLSRKLLRREYELSAHLDHPNLSRVFFYGKFVDGKEGILMEYIDGRSLQDFLLEKPSMRAKTGIFSQLLDVVGYLHKAGIIHNDLKPENILVTKTSDTLRLIDFGLADDDLHFLIKTPGFSKGFAAPELKENGQADVKSDIYSIGCLMRLIFGRRWKSIRGKCIKKNPERRYSGSTDLQRAWQKRNRPYWIVGAALLLTLIAGVIWMYVAEKEDQRIRLERMEGELASQKDINEKQIEEFLKLQTTYSEVSGSYENLSQTYQGIKDSIEASHRTTETHEQAKNAAISGFRAGLEKRMHTTFDSLKRCESWKQMNSIRQRYDAAVRKYYASYPKIADGEDITAVLAGLLQSNLEESRELFNTEISRLHK